MDVLSRHTFADWWKEFGRDPKQLEPIGREMAEAAGQPALAEKTLLRKAVIAPVEKSASYDPTPPQPYLLPVIHSTDSVDRAGDIVRQGEEAWDLKSFNERPIICLSHNTWDPTQDIIGRETNLKPMKHPLKGIVEYIPDDRGARLVSVARFIGSLGQSVGFIPLEYEPMYEDIWDGGRGFVGSDLQKNRRLQFS